MPCEACGTEQIRYNSWRNRHCPKCQGRARAQWLKAEQALLLPVPYFHVVFTLPHQLNPLIRVNQRALYNLLFQAGRPRPCSSLPVIPTTWEPRSASPPCSIPGGRP